MASENIFAQYAQPIRSVLDYGAEYDKRDLLKGQLEGQQRQNALAGLAYGQQVQDSQAKAAESNALRQIAAASGGDRAKFMQGLESSGLPGLIGQAQSMRKQDADTGHVLAQTDKERITAGKDKAATVFDTLKGYRASLDYIDTPAGAARWLQAQYQDPVTADHMQRLAPIEQSLQGIPQDPQGFNEWRQKAAMGMDAYAKKVQEDAKIAEAGRSNRANETINVDNNVRTNATHVQAAGIAAATQRRGQDMNDQRQRDKNEIDKSAVGKVEWKQDADGNWLALPKEVKNGDKVTPIATTAPGKREVQAGHALDIISDARDLIKKGTSSYAGAAVDQGARVFGASTAGSEAGAKLRALEGALMMAQPRMEGPQSDKDVMLYKQMAGQIGDPTVPAGNKAAALDAIEGLHKKYAPNAVKSGGQQKVVKFGDLK